MCHRSFKQKGVQSQEVQRESKQPEGPKVYGVKVRVPEVKTTLRPGAIRFRKSRQHSVLVQFDSGSQDNAPFKYISTPEVTTKQTRQRAKV